VDARIRPLTSIPTFPRISPKLTFFVPATLFGIAPILHRLPDTEAWATKLIWFYFRDVPVEMRDKISALKKQDKSLAEVIAAKPGLARTTNGASPSSGPPTLLLWCTCASEKICTGAYASGNLVVL
jgi:hypothetical protein